ncbi:MAG: hypothetical protein M3O82_01995, partial [Verrucomicrobiota bacterium]|nr:hypothetical protein [Verrucomicrobiota bacterium]
LMLREFRAAKVGANFISRAVDFSQSPISADEVLKHETFWTELRRMQDTGIFGGRGAIRDEFSFTGDYPLATLPIDRDLAEEKWALTHPAFAGANGEEDE